MYPPEESKSTKTIKITIDKDSSESIDVANLSRSSVEHVKSEKQSSRGRRMSNRSYKNSISHTNLDKILSPQEGINMLIQTGQVVSSGSSSRSRPSKRSKRLIQKKVTQLPPDMSKLQFSSHTTTPAISQKSAFGRPKVGGATHAADKNGAQTKADSFFEQLEREELALAKKLKSQRKGKELPPQEVMQRFGVKFDKFDEESNQQLFIDKESAAVLTEEDEDSDSELMGSVHSRSDRSSQI